MLDTKLKKWKTKSLLDSLLALVLTTVIVVGTIMGIIIGIGTNYSLEEDNYYLSRHFDNQYSSYVNDILLASHNYLFEYNQEDNAIDDEAERANITYYLPPRFYFRVTDKNSGQIIYESEDYQHASTNAIVYSEITNETNESLYLGNGEKKQISALRRYNDTTEAMSQFNYKIDVVLKAYDASSDEYYNDYLHKEFLKYGFFAQFKTIYPQMLIGTYILGIIAVVLLFVLIGRRYRFYYPKGFIDKIPTDITFILGTITVTLYCVLFIDVVDFSRYVSQSEMDKAFQIIIVMSMWLCAYLTLALFLSLVHALMNRKLIKNSLVYRVCKWFFGGIFGFVNDMFRGTKLQKRLSLYLVLTCFAIFMNIMAVAAMSSGLLVIMLIVDVFIAFKAVRYVISIGRIANVLDKREKGHVEESIAIEKLDPSFRPMAEQINNMQLGLNQAIQKAIKGERLKTELITNVSHDLKTPLTSIINFVALLKKKNLQDEEAAAYIGVIDEKSQRLKLLIDDILDVSKISTGNVEIQLESIDINQMMVQILAEYEDRFDDLGLNRIESDFTKPYYVSADSNKLWRVIENVLSNVTKYAMENSRVYLSTVRKDNFTQLEIKNISKHVLTQQGADFLERFARGDASRSTEGSGLGLAIANDLIILMKGHFEIIVDGDLFKVMITLKNAKAPDIKEPIISEERLSDELIEEVRESEPKAID